MNRDWWCWKSSSTVTLMVNLTHDKWHYFVHSLNITECIHFRWNCLIWLNTHEEFLLSIFSCYTRKIIHKSNEKQKVAVSRQFVQYGSVFEANRAENLSLATKLICGTTSIFSIKLCSDPFVVVWMRLFLLQLQSKLLQCMNRSSWTVY
jgi:hypothetical protein